MSKQKAQGTKLETWTRNALRDLGFKSRRLAEGGAEDEGDVDVVINDTRWVVECKSTQTLNIQETLGKARRKAGGAPVFLVWKRLVQVAGKKMRQPVAGERIVVVLGWDDFTDLLSAARDVTAGDAPAQPEGGTDD